MPIACGLLLAGLANEDALKLAEGICIKMGQYFQVQFADTSMWPTTEIVGPVIEGLGPVLFGGREESMCTFLPSPTPTFPLISQLSPSSPYLSLHTYLLLPLPFSYTSPLPVAQIQDDYLDCYGDPEVIGKIGTDIEDSKCSWLVVQALQRARPEQRAVIQECYGLHDAEKVAKVKKVYEELQLEDLFKKYEEDTYKELVQEIEGQSLVRRGRRSH